MFRNSSPRLPLWLFSLLVSLVSLVSAQTAQAAGSFKLKSSEATEVSGAWHVYVTLELPKAPATAHMPIKFVFTKTAEYERALIDGKTEPVLNRIALVGQNPSVESLDVDFADGSGKIFKQTRFDFGLTRARGYVAGEYKVQVRTSDGTDIGGSTNITLKGDNDVIDRRAMTFNAKDPKIKKVDDGTGAPKANAGGTDGPSAAAGNGDVAPTGTAAPFISQEAYEKTPEEDIKVKKGGCGCDLGATQLGFGSLAGLLPALALLMRRRHVRPAV